MDAFVQRIPRASRAGSGKDTKNDVQEPPAKKAKTDSASRAEADFESSDEFSSKDVKRVAAPEDTTLEDSDVPAKARPTDVENALPATQDEEEAIHEYEAMKLAASSPHTSQDGTAPTSLPQWMKGRSSIYVDAFILALDTVLEDESHLFDEVEREIFQQWKQLDYEAQYLYDPTVP